MILLAAAYYVYPLLVGPSHVIKDVNAFVEDDNVVIQVNFNAPIRYEDHFPQNYGQALQVKFRLIALHNTEEKEVIAQEAIRPELAKLTSLVNITFEGNVPDGPLLTFLFNRPVEYEVHQDKSLHGLVVVLPKSKLVKAES